MGYAGGPLDNRTVGIGTQLGSVAGNTLVLRPEDKRRVNETKPVYTGSDHGTFIQGINAEATGRDCWTCSDDSVWRHVRLLPKGSQGLSQC